MKIKLSKKQWQEIGSKSGWMKVAQAQQPQAQQPQAQQPQAQQQPPATPTLSWLGSSMDKVLNSGAIQKEVAALVSGGGSAQTMANSLIGQLQMVIQQITNASQGNA